MNFALTRIPDIDDNRGYSSSPVVVVSSSGKICFSWEDARNHGINLNQTDVYAKIFDESGTPLGNDFQVSQDPLPNRANPTSIAATSSENFIIVWDDYREETFPNNPDAYARAFTPAGTPLADEFIVNTANQISSTRSADVACAPSGRCLAIYTGNMGRHLDSNGVLLDAEFVVRPASTVVAAAVAGNNSFVSVWSGYIVDAPIMANIMGPNDAIPTTSGVLLIILAALFMGLIIFASKRKIYSEGVRA